MSNSQSKKFFLIIFLALSFLWIGYQAFVLPILANRRAESEFARSVGECTNNFRASAEVDEAAEQSCMVRANGLYVIRRTAISRRYSPEGLPSLLIVSLGFPLIVYAFAIACAALVRRPILRTGPQAYPRAT